MSTKKRKKQGKRPTTAASSGQSTRLVGSKDTKKFKPGVLQLLLLNLIFLAVVQILEERAIIDEATSGVMTLVGAGLILLAMYLQFGKNDKNEPPVGKTLLK